MSQPDLSPVFHRHHTLHQTIHHAVETVTHTVCNMLACFHLPKGVDIVMVGKPLHCYTSFSTLVSLYWIAADDVDSNKVFKKDAARRTHISLPLDPESWKNLIVKLYNFFEHHKDVTTDNLTVDHWQTFPLPQKRQFPPSLFFRIDSFLHNISKVLIPMLVVLMWLKYFVICET